MTLQPDESLEMCQQLEPVASVRLDDQHHDATRPVAVEPLTDEAVAKETPCRIPDSA
jgi:hypothetical protein